MEKIILLLTLLLSFSLVTNITDHSGTFQIKNIQTLGLKNNNITISEGNKISQIIQKIDQKKIENYLDRLIYITKQYGDRRTGSDGSVHSAQYIYDSINDMNDSLLLRMSQWSMFGDIWCPGLYSDKNIIAELPGKLSNRSTIVFFVHYDTIKDSLGADDDGSGVAALLTIANVMSEYSFNHTLIFCASSGEQEGFLGDNYESRLFYETDTDILAAIVADAIGYMPNVENTNRSNSVFLYRPERSQWIADFIIDVFETHSSLIKLNNILIGDFYRHSGDTAYDNYGFSTLKFFEGITNPGWEQPPYNNDTIEYINFSYLTNVTKLIAGTLAYMADLPALDPKISINSPSEDSLLVNGKVIYWSPLFKGLTICFGDVTVEAGISSQSNIENVVFELITGDNDIQPGDEERKVIATVNDTTYPYEYTISENIWGWYTIRATVCSTEGSQNSDEIEIFFI